MKRARVSVRREGYQQQQGQEDRQGGQEWWGPWTAAPPLSAAGRGGTEWAVRVGTGRAVGGGGGDGDRPRRGREAEKGKRRHRGSSRLAAAESRGRGVVGPATPSASAQLSRMASAVTVGGPLVPGAQRQRHRGVGGGGPRACAGGTATACENFRWFAGGGSAVTVLASRHCTQL